jgi:ABC-2 type transport system permease protein
LAWIVFGFYSVTIGLLALPQVLSNVLILTTLLLIFVICPLVAIMGLSLGVIVSSRANDPRTAQQIGGILILPIVGLFIAQTQGLYFLTPSAVFTGIAVLALLDIVIFRIGVALFDRETILLRWR